MHFAHIGTLLLGRPLNVIHSNRHKSQHDPKPGKLPGQLVRIFIAVGWVLAFSSIAAAAEPVNTNTPSAESKATPTTPSPTTPADIERWINELGDDAFNVRQEAAAQLLAAGMAGREQLGEVVEGPDPEKRAAARRLIALIDRSEFRRRLDAFAADTDGRQNLSLPGWEEFQKLVGGDAAARALFVDIQRQEGALLAAVFGASRRAPEELYEARLLQVAQWQSVVGDRSAAPPIGSAAGMVFLGSVPQIPLSDSAASLVENLIQRPPIITTLQGDNPEGQETVKKLAVGWLLNCSNKNESILRERLGIISSRSLKDGLPLALAVCSADPQYLHVLPQTKANAIQIVGQLGGREHVDLLEPLLEDKTVCLQVQPQVPNQPPAAVQTRDVALCVMLLLTQQPTADYGYLNARIQSPRMFQLPSLAAKMISSGPSRLPSGGRGELLTKTNSKQNRRRPPPKQVPPSNWRLSYAVGRFSGPLDVKRG